MTGTSWRRPWVRRGAIVAVLGVMFVGLMLGAQHLLPPVLKDKAQRLLSEQLGREVTVGGIEVDPWRLAVTVNQLQVAGPSRERPQLLVARIHADASLASLWHRAPVIEQLRIESPYLALARTGEGQYDVDDVLRKLMQPKPDAKPDEPPARIAIHNVELQNGSIDFDDRPVRGRQEVRALTVTLPFISTLPADVDVRVEPHLAFTLGTLRFDTQASSLPFTPARETALNLDIQNLDLSRLRPYVPASVAMVPDAGRLDAQLQLKFAQPPGRAPSVGIEGAATIAGMKLGTRKGAPLVNWERLQLAIKDAQPLARRIVLGPLRLDGLALNVRRDADGRLEFERVFAARPQAPAAAAPRPAAANDPDWNVAIESVALNGASVMWRDEAVQPAAALTLASLAVNTGPMAFPLPDAMAVQASATLHGADAQAGAGQFQLQLKKTGEKWQLTGDVQALQLAALQPYTQTVLVPTLQGQLSTAATAEWSGDDPMRATVRLPRATLENFALAGAAGPAAKTARTAKAAAPAATASAVHWQALEVADVAVHPGEARAEIGSVTLRKPGATLERGADGQFNVLQWLRADAGQAQPAGGKAAPADKTPAKAPAAGKAGPATAGSTPAWQVALKRLEVQNAEVTWRDHAPPHPVAGATRLPLQVQARELTLSASDLAWPAQRPANVRLRTRVVDGNAVADRQAQAATLAWAGRVGLSPLLAEGRVQLERLPVHVADAYVDPGLGLSLQRALASAAGNVSVKQARSGIEARYDGDARLADVHVFGLSPATRALQTDELLGWQLLALNKVKVAVKPGGPPAIDIGDASVADLQARLVVTEQGQFNLREATEVPSRAPSQSVQPEPFDKAQDRPVEGKSQASTGSARTGGASSQPGGASSQPGEASSQPGGTSSQPAVAFRLGGLALSNARIDYSDNFVKPNYRAALTNLEGRIGSFDSANPREMATIELQGNVAGTGRLEIRGSLNPTAKPLALDIAAKATEVELAPLSPYSGKYAGYGIERGKLSMDVHYNVQPDGRLDAKNRVVLNQLTFGDKVDSPDATTLPVRLAVALLKDRNGVIDIDLPVQGSLSDPQFSVFGLVVKVIVNLIGKAITSPFSLFAGGGDELKDVGFMAGTAQISDAGRGVIDKVAQALSNRPAVRMTVAGAADPASESDALRAAMVQRQVVQYLRRERVQAGDAAQAAGTAPAVPPADRERALRALYRETELPARPANYVELSRTLPPDQIEQQLRAGLRVGEDVARELALQRGIAVRDALAAKGIGSERLFIGAPVLRSSSEDDPAWSPHVRLTLSAD